MLSYFISFICNLSTISGTQIALHRIVITKGRSSSTNFSTHVTDCAFTGTRDALRTFTEIFYHTTGTTFYSELTGYPQYNIFRSGPAIQFTFQVHTNKF